MKTDKLHLLIVLISFFLISCEDVFEKDIESIDLELTTPTDNQIIETSTVNFSWIEHDDIKKYQLQVFNQNHLKVEDTITDQTALQLPLDKGTFYCKLRGVNDAYQTNFTEDRSFKVQLSDDLANYSVLLESPSDQKYTSSPNLVLKWSNIVVADRYQVKLINSDASTEVTIPNADNITLNTLTLNSTILNQDAKYSWSVRAINAQSQTDFSQERHFFLDTKEPTSPSLVTPTDDFIVNINDQVEFSWLEATDQGTVQSPIHYVVEIALDEGFNQIEDVIETTSLSEKKTFSSAKIVYWRVVAVDKAGNKSVVQAKRKLTIQ